MSALNNPAINTDGRNRFEKMPNEIKGEVLSYLDIDTLDKFSDISRDFCSTVNNPAFLENNPIVTKIDELGQQIFPSNIDKSTLNRFLTTKKEPSRIKKTHKMLYKINDIKIKDTITIWEKIYEQSTQILGMPAISIPIFDEIKKLTDKKEVKKAFGDWIEQNNNNIHLGSLVLNDLGLHFLPKQLFNLAQLHWLYLRDNNLTSIPKEIGNLTQLLRLNLRDNNLIFIPKEIGNLTQLRELGLEENNLTSIPKEIGNLTLLHWLYLEENNLTSIPKEIGNLTLLHWLYLQKNNLTSIPKEIVNLTQLQALYLSKNNLTSIPKEIGNLTLLYRLTLSNNNLSHYPECLDRLTNTKIFGKNILIAHEIIRFLGGYLAHVIYDNTHGSIIGKKEKRS